MLTPMYLPDVGGTQLAIRNIANSLTQQGHRVTVVTVTPSMTPSRNEEGVRVIRIYIPEVRGISYVNSNIRCFRRVVEEHSSQPFNYLHLFHFFHLGLTAIALRKTLQLPLMTSLMGADTYSPTPEMAPPNVAGRFSRLLAPCVMNSSDLVTAPSDELASHARRQGCRKEIIIIPHGVNPDRFSPSDIQTRTRLVRERLGISKDELMVLTVHRLDRRKDLATAILALRNVLRHKPNVKLIVVGIGPEHERFLEIARREGVAASVIFVGYVSEQELPSYYAAADLFLLSSFYEAFGLVLVEAMAAGKCVVASNVGGVPEIVRNQITGFLFPVGDVDTLASILLKALEDEKLRVEMGCLGRKRVLDHYSWAGIARRYSNAYTSLSTQLCRTGPD
ncbi:MAG: glycosyltransferase family 4 protein [Candidatus Bathyarchaeia archaeon]